MLHGKKKLEWKGPIFIEQSFKEGERGGSVWGNWWVRLRDIGGGVNLRFKRDEVKGEKGWTGSQLYFLRKWVAWSNEWENV